MDEQQNQKNNSGYEPPPIRTYRSDVEGLIKNEGTTMTDIALAEETKRRSALTEEVEKPKRISLAIKISIAIIAFAVATFGVYWVTKQFVTRKAPVVENDALSSVLVKLEKKQEIDVDSLSKENLWRAIQAVQKQPMTPGQIVGIVLIKKNPDGSKTILGPTDFLSIVKVKLPTQLERSLEPEFAIGYHQAGGAQPFIVLKTGFYQNAFSGMLEWENTLNKDLAEIFPNKSAAEPATATTTAPSDLALKEIRFKDRLIKSKDVRVLERGDGKIFLMYSMPDRKSIVITNNENTLNEVANRLIK